MRYHYYAPVPRGLQRTSLLAAEMHGDAPPTVGPPPRILPPSIPENRETYDAQQSVSMSDSIMQLLFEPIEMCFRCVPPLKRWCGNTAEDRQQAPEEGCFSALRGPWRAQRALKDLIIVASVTLFVFVLVWEISIHQAMQAWEVGGRTGVVGSCTLSTAPLGTMTLSSYIGLRLSGTLLSLAPMLYLVCMAVHHLQQVANGAANGPWRRHPWLTTFVVLEFVLSLFLLVLDGSVASSLATNWNPGAPCYEAERQMLHYTPTIRLPINTLPIALIVLSLPMTVWSALFIVHDAITPRA